MPADDVILAFVYFSDFGHSATPSFIHLGFASGISVFVVTAQVVRDGVRAYDRGQQFDPFLACLPVSVGQDMNLGPLVGEVLGLAKLL